MTEAKMGVVDESAYADTLLVERNRLSKLSVLGTMTQITQGYA